MPLLCGRTQHFTTLGRVAHKYNLQLKIAEYWHVFFIYWFIFSFSLHETNFIHSNSNL